MSFAGCLMRTTTKEGVRFFRKLALDELLPKLHIQLLCTSQTPPD
jgi:hypothetical protein